jgi:hypothetical protein
VPNDSLRGAEQFLALSKALKAAGKTELRKELHKQMRIAAKAAMPTARKRLEESLPSGLKNRSNVRQVVRVKTGMDAGVTIAVPYGRRNRSGLSAPNARMLNSRGALRHPVFAPDTKTSDQWRWVNQRVSGTAWFDSTYARAAPALRKALEAAMDAVGKQIVKGARRG